MVFIGKYIELLAINYVINTFSTYGDIRNSVLTDQSQAINICLKTQISLFKTELTNLFKFRVISLLENLRNKSLYNSENESTEVASANK